MSTWLSSATQKRPKNYSLLLRLILQPLFIFICPSFPLWQFCFIFLDSFPLFISFFCLCMSSFTFLCFFSFYSLAHSLWQFFFISLDSLDLFPLSISFISFSLLCFCFSSYSVLFFTLSLFLSLTVLLYLRQILFLSHLSFLFSFFLPTYSTALSAVGNLPPQIVQLGVRTLKQ